MRNIAKLVSLALVVAAAPLLSACNNSEPTQAKSQASPNEAWSRLHRTLWPTQHGQPIPLPVARRPTATEAFDYSAANPGYSKDLKDLHNAAEAWAAREAEPEPSAQRRRPRAEHPPAGARHRRAAVRHRPGNAQYRKGS
jgi:hypothetical protein